MPTVTQFDSPALVATLAGNAGRFAENQDQMQQVQQVVQLMGQERAQREQQAMQEQQFRAAQAAGGGGVDPRMAAYLSDPTRNGGTETLGQGFQPAGQPAAGQYAHGGPHGIPGALPVTHQAIFETISQMQQSGQLSPEEANRWIGIAAAGGNPLTEKTEAEQLRIKAAGQKPAGGADGLTDYQRGQLGLRGMTGQNRMDDVLYERKRKSILDQIEAKQKRLNNASGSDERTKISGELQDLEKKLEQLPTEAEGTPQLTPNMPGQPGGAADQGSGAIMSYLNGLMGGKGPKPADKANGGSMSIQTLKPLSQDVIDSYIAKAGGDPATAKRLARQDGYAVP